ncbi:5119_t:CDS:1 [Funneliformis geosporum]|uniref:carbonic anhydrase n=1 Tax=Funneliformis geosporum TaxID=1117311 RepID=A0A9W4SHS0_9GLOM|nr:7359_t:CDS:1 [Funneliformis geosporum]CAI2170252.1 5119_t:CDS:1 [Funneliformis geosporum]
MKVTSLISFILLASLSNFNLVSAAEEKIKFGYTGSIGPDVWHLLSEESKVCQTGKMQSPIDIISQDLKTLAKPPQPEFKNAKDVVSFNNGNTVEVFSGKEGTPLPATIKVDGETYDLQQFHFHTPSEHRINGKHFDIEQHLVFTSKDEKVSVVAVFYDVGKEESKFMAPIVKDLPKNIDDEKKINEIDLSGLLTDIQNITAAFTYSGSLTTPPCTEGVTWYVNKDAQVVSLDQFLGLRDVTGFNSRFTQLRAEDQIKLENDINHQKRENKRSLYKFDRFLKNKF